MCYKHIHQSKLCMPIQPKHLINTKNASYQKTSLNTEWQKNKQTILIRHEISLHHHFQYCSKNHIEKTHTKKGNRELLSYPPEVQIHPSQRRRKRYGIPKNYNKQIYVTHTKVIPIQPILHIYTPHKHFCMQLILRRQLRLNTPSICKMEPDPPSSQHEIVPWQ